VKRGAYLSQRETPCGSGAHLDWGEETGLRISAVFFWSHRLTTSIVYCYWAWPSRPRGQRKPVPWGLQCKSVAPVRHAIVWHHLPCRLSCHRILFSASIAQNDGIDNLATLHTALGGTLRLADAEEYIHVEVGHHESAASGACRIMRDCRSDPVTPALFSSCFLGQCSGHDDLPRYRVHYSLR